MRPVPTVLIAVVMMMAMMMAVPACGDDAADTGVAAADLDGRAFTATEIAGGELAEGTEITITFVDGLVVAEAGCNTQRGGYTVEDGELRVETLTSTLMACEDARMEQDRFVADLLGSGPAIRLDGDELVLTGEDASLTLTAVG